MDCQSNADGTTIIGFGQEGRQYCRTGGRICMYHRVVKCFGVFGFYLTDAGQTVSRM